MFTFPTMSRSTNTKTAKQGDGTELGICVTIVVQSSISVYNRVIYFIGSTGCRKTTNHRPTYSCLGKYTL